MDLIGLSIAAVTGAGLLGSGMLTGYILGRRAATRERPTPPPQPVCGCDHHLAHHHPESKVCKAAVQQRYQTSGGSWRVRWVDCACQQYTGPEPITSEIWVPPVLTEGGGR